MDSAKKASGHMKVGFPGLEQVSAPLQHRHLEETWQELTVQTALSPMDICTDSQESHRDVSVYTTQTGRYFC